MAINNTYNYGQCLLVECIFIEHILKKRNQVMQTTFIMGKYQYTLDESSISQSTVNFV